MCWFQDIIAQLPMTSLLPPPLDKVVGGDIYSISFAVRTSTTQKPEATGAAFCNTAQQHNPQRHPTPPTRSPLHPSSARASQHPAAAALHHCGPIRFRSFRARAASMPVVLAVVSGSLISIDCINRANRAYFHKSEAEEAERRI